MEHLGPNIQISVTKNQTLAIVFQPVACLLNFVVCYGKKTWPFFQSRSDRYIETYWGIFAACECYVLLSQKKMPPSKKLLQLEFSRKNPFKLGEICVEGQVFKGTIKSGSKIKCWKTFVSGGGFTLMDFRICGNWHWPNFGSGPRVKGLLSTCVFCSSRVENGIVKSPKPVQIHQWKLILFAWCESWSAFMGPKSRKGYKSQHKPSRLGFPILDFVDLRMSKVPPRGKENLIPSKCLVVRP